MSRREHNAGRGVADPLERRKAQTIFFLAFVPENLHQDRRSARRWSSLRYLIDVWRRRHGADLQPQGVPETVGRGVEGIALIAAIEGVCPSPRIRLG